MKGTNSPKITLSIYINQGTSLTHGQVDVETDMGDIASDSLSTVSVPKPLALPPPKPEGVVLRTKPGRKSVRQSVGPSVKPLFSPNMFQTTELKQPAPILPVSTFSVLEPSAPETDDPSPICPQVSSPRISMTPMNTVLGLLWIDPGNKSDSFHGVDSVLFAALLEIKAFDSDGSMDDQTFSEFVGGFGEKLSNSKLLGSVSEEERFFPLFGLALLLQSPPRIPLDSVRVTQFLDVLFPILDQNFQVFSAYHLKRFQAGFKQLFDESGDPDSVCQSFDQAFQGFQQQTRIPPIMVNFVSKAMLEAVDVALVNRIYMQSTKCDFMTSIIWNTFSSHARSFAKIPMNFDLFSEAVEVIQMTAAIDEDPNTIGDICPHLPPAVVLALLSVRELDDDLTRKPDVAKFASAHNLDLYSDFQPMKVDTRALFTISESVPTNSWKQVPIPRDFFGECAFLQEMFV